MKKNSVESFCVTFDLPIISASAKLKHYGKIKNIRANDLLY
jgi:hypothetical protein